MHCLRRLHVVVVHGLIPALCAPMQFRSASTSFWSSSWNGFAITEIVETNMVSNLCGLVVMPAEPRAQLFVLLRLHGPLAPWMPVMWRRCFLSWPQRPKVQLSRRTAIVEGWKCACLCFFHNCQSLIVLLSSDADPARMRHTFPTLIVLRSQMSPNSAQAKVATFSFC